MKRHRTQVLELALAAGVLLARVPFLFAGYGSDPDAWRVAWAGQEIMRSGRYLGSRAPGNPVVEFAAAALAGTPPWAMNALTAVLGAAAVACFGILLRRLGCRVWLAGALALAFTPVVAIHSADAMDYMWALAFLLAAWLAALGGRPGLAGLLIGVATGCRITSAAMLVPLSIVAAVRTKNACRDRALAVATLWGAGLLATVAAFAPAIARSGLTFLHGYPHGFPRPLYLVKLLTVDVWGVVGCGALAWAGALVLIRRGRLPAEPALGGRVDGILPAAAVTVAVELALFFRAPYEAGYLIPAVPFTLLLFARALGRREFVALCAGIALSTFMVKVNEPGNLAPTATGAIGSRLDLGAYSLQVNLWPGPLVADEQRREAGVRYVEDVRKTARRLTGPVAIAAGEWLPSLLVKIGGSHDGNASYFYSLSLAQMDSLQQGGAAVYDLPGAEECTRLMHGYSLRDAGSRLLEVP